MWISANHDELRHYGAYAYTNSNAYTDSHPNTYANSNSNTDPYTNSYPDSDTNAFTSFKTSLYSATIEHCCWKHYVSVGQGSDRGQPWEPGG
jgi:hypothetical protein